MHDGGLRIPEVRGDGQDPGVVDDRPRLLPAAVHVEGHDAAGGALLPRRQRVARMGFQAGVVDAAHRRMAFEPAREPRRALADGVHADAQRLQAVQEDPGVERAHARPRGAQQREQRVMVRGVAGDHRAAHATALPVEVLGRRVHHDAGAELDRPRQRRRAQAVVDHQGGAVPARQRAEGGDVHDLPERIGRALREEHLRSGTDGAGPRIEVGGVDERRLDAEPREDVREQRDRRAEEAVGGDRVLAAAQQHHRGHEDRGHPRRGGDASGAAFQGREPPLERAHGGVREPGVDVAGGLAGEPGGGLPGVREHEARSEEDRVVVLLLAGPGLPGAHRQGIESERAGVELVHAGLPPDRPPAMPAKKTRVSESFGGPASALAAFIERPQAEASNRRWRAL